MLPTASPHPPQEERPACPTASIGKPRVEHGSRLRQWLRLCLGNAQDAADFAHGTFVRVFASRSAEALREPHCYLSASVRALMSDSFRRCATEQAYLDSLAARPEPLDIPAQTRLSILETLTAIDLALDGMGERTRQVFLAVQLEGLTYRSAGERLGVSMTTVENHMVRAMTRCLLLCKD